MSKFVYLKPALAVIMLFVGVKMLLSATPYAIETQWSLAVILLTMSVAVVASIFKQRAHKDKQNKHDSATSEI